VGVKVSQRKRQRRKRNRNWSDIIEPGEAVLSDGNKLKKITGKV